MREIAMRIAIVGCGYVADYYLKTLPSHPELELLGVTDRQGDRATKFAQFYNIPRVYSSVAELLADDRVDIVVNLTNPRSHYEVSKAALAAGKHVYSEKPLAMEMWQAEELVSIAEAKGLLIASAPCSVLSETAQSIWKALREHQIGDVRLVYAEMDDGLVHKMPYKKWLSESGTPWPYMDEFEVGCTLEHAGYYTTWLTAFFGPAESVTAFSANLFPDKETDKPLNNMAPDFSVACIKFKSGVVARLTCSIVAPHDHKLRIFGDEGSLEIEECWLYGAPISIRRNLTIGRKRLEGFWKQRYPLARKATHFRNRVSQLMDYSRGIDELAGAISEQRPCRISAQFSLHNNELVLAIGNALETGAPHQLKSTFEPVEPMPWAK
jgi:predicted dehydrogenase